MSLHEIVLPQTKPKTEWVRGRALRKVSPTYSQARLQTLIAMALTEWADSGGHGLVGTEWRFRITPRIAPRAALTRPLVPDVAYLSYDALSRDAPGEDVEVPRTPPTLAVEILSPDDWWSDVEDKVRTYLLAGTAVVLIADPQAGALYVRDRFGRRSYVGGDTFSHEALPGFSIDIAALFKRARI